MKESNIFNIINEGENQKTEFKTSFGKAVIESVVAFSNTNGGKVIIGINDSKEIVGIDLSSETIKNFINEIKQNTNPQVIPDIFTFKVDHKNIVVIEVPEYPVKPVSFKNKYFKRFANSNHLMSLDEIANEYIKTINSSWDFYPDGIHTLENISTEKVERFINKIEKRTDTQIKLSPLEFLNKLEFLRNNQLTYGAYLLFVKDFCSISDVQVGRFKSDITIIDSISLNSDLFTEVDEIIAFIKKHLMVEFIITGKPQRDERFDYPLDAIREIVVNMVVHRDYRDSSGSIIKIFDNRIEFYNPGKLYGDITLTDLLSGNYSSKVRNKLIARAFKEAGIIEKYGSGIKRVLDICKDQGIIPPKFEEVFNGLKVTLFKEKLTGNVIDSINYEAIDSTENDTENDTEKRIGKIMQMIKINKKISVAKLAKECGVSRITISRDVDKLKSSGILKRIGPDKGGYWETVK